MGEVIQNLRYFKGIIEDTALEEIAFGASLHRRHSNITFKIISIFPPKKAITIEVRQEQNPESDQYFSTKRLVLLTRDLIEKHIPPGWRLYVNVVHDTHPPFLIVTPKWLSRQMEELGIKAKKMAKETGVTRDEIIEWLSDKRELNTLVKSMLYYYFRAKRLDQNKRREDI